MIARPLAWALALLVAGGAHAALALAIARAPIATPASSEPQGFLALDLAALPVPPRLAEPDEAQEAPAVDALAGDAAEEAAEAAPEEPLPQEPEREEPVVAVAEADASTEEPVAEEPITERPLAEAPVEAPAPVALPPARPRDLPRIAQAPPKPAASTRRASPGRDAFDSAARAPRAEPSATASAPAGRQALGDPAAERRWQQRLLAHLERHKRYPASARAARVEGVVHLAFTLDAGGRVVARSIARSSGAPDLDAAVLDMIARAEPLPAPPDASGPTRLVVPVSFRLR